MNIRVTTTATGMIVTDLDTGMVLKWADVVEIGFDATSGRTVTYIGTFDDTAIEVKSASVSPTPPSTPKKPTP